MKKLILFILAVCSVSIMFYFSSRTAQISSHQSDFIIDLLQNIGIVFNSHTIRKLAHVIIFSIISFCISMFIGCYLDKIFWISSISFLLSLCYACVDEYLQTFIDGRHGCVGDVMIDACGIVIGLILYCIIINIIDNK